MKKIAVIVAGGSGSRMGSALPKQFMPINGKSLIGYTIDTFLRSFADMEVILVLPEQYMDNGNKVVNASSDPGRIRSVTGGSSRFYSVQNGIRLIKDDSVVFVHDGVRCLVSTTLIQRCYEGAMRLGSAIPAVKATDSLRLETSEGNSIINREQVRNIQTPQTFLNTILKPAFEQPFQESFTDEASVVENMGIPVHLIEGELTNLKITTPLDMLVAGEILKMRAQGQGRAIL